MTPQRPGSASVAEVASSVFPAGPYSRLLQRIGLLALLYSVELIVITIVLDDASLAGRVGLVSYVYAFGSWILRGIVGVAILFATFLHLGHRPLLTQLSEELAGAQLNWKLFAAHGLAVASFGSASYFLYGEGVASDLLTGSWLLAGCLALMFGALAVLPLRFWSSVLRNARYLWILTVVAVFLACLVGNASRSLWNVTARATFVLARVMLAPFVSQVFSDLANMSLGTPRFHVEIAPECSGLEGMALIVAFGAGWLTIFRRECRFPHALALIPAGVVVMFVLNALRITALILIGNAGAERIALGGFHSQAGWIAFNVVAVGFVLCAGSMPGIMLGNPAGDAKSAAPSSAVNPVAPFVMPFVLILAVGMLSRALTADFEWLYPLRLAAAAVAIAAFSGKYKTLDLRFDWSAIATGIAVFVLWIGADHFSAGSSNVDAMPRALAAASPAPRFAWIAARVLAASVTVPFAEEFAFRGFLFRRVISADFESVSFSRFTLPALIVSSVAFGLLHGDRWLAGTIAGLVYALSMLRRGRIMNAVVAHATTNALLAAYVLSFHQWHLW